MVGGARKPLRSKSRPEDHVWTSEVTTSYLKSNKGMGQLTTSRKPDPHQPAVRPGSSEDSPALELRGIRDTDSRALDLTCGEL